MNRAVSEFTLVFGALTVTLLALAHGPVRANDDLVPFADCFNEGEPGLHGEALQRRLAEADRRLAEVFAQTLPHNDVEPAPPQKGSSLDIRHSSLAPRPSERDSAIDGNREEPLSGARTNSR